MSIITTTPCPRCNGSGRLEDPRIIGAACRARRIARAGPRSLTATARLMGISASHLADYEAGARRMTAARLADHRRAVATLAGTAGTIVLNHRT